MDLEEGQRILQDFRDSYEWFVSLDKKYNETFVPWRNEKFEWAWEKKLKSLRREYNDEWYRINDTIWNVGKRYKALAEHMATYPHDMPPLDYSDMMATYLVTDRNWNCPISIGRIAAPVQHSFCVADYQPDANTPTCVLEMIASNAGAALVIDPWMKIVCKFGSYPAELKLKLSLWKTKGKIISKGGSEFRSPKLFYDDFLMKPLSFRAQPM